VRIALDAMGSDRHPEPEVRGALEALRDLPSDIEVLLVGDRERVEAEVARQAGGPVERLHYVHAGDRIMPADAPATAVRRKPDSSIVRGLSLQREGLAHAFVSAGSTGAVMAASLFILRPLPGVDRPTVATALPTAGETTVMVDAGANVDCKPHQLLQFGKLGAIYVEEVLGRPRPRVGLLNIGEEAEKGNELSVEVNRLLRESDLNFIGNVEGRDIIRGVCDVLVTDGFAGNVLLKFYESVAGYIVDVLRRELRGMTLSPALEQAMRVLDYTEYGGAPLLGVNGISIICHGGSPPQAIKNAIRVAAQAVEARIRRQGEYALSTTGASGEASARRMAEG
jgi:phosphate acyltransferase